MKSKAPFLVSLLLTLVVAPAMAEDELQKCIMEDGETLAAMSLQDLNNALFQANKALTDSELDDARFVLETLYGNLRCLSHPIPPTEMVRFAQTMSQMAFYDQDEVNSVRWAFLANLLVPEMPWPARIGAEHPLRSALEWNEAPEESGPTGKVIAPPAKGLFLLNGRAISSPKALAELPGLVQVFDKKGLILDGYWQDGAMFHEKYLADREGVAPPPPKWFVAQDVNSAVAQYRVLPEYSGEPVGEGVAETGGTEQDGATEAVTPAGDGATEAVTPAGDGATEAVTPAGDGATEAVTPAGDGAAEGPKPAGDGVAEGPKPAGDGAAEGPKPAGDGVAEGPKAIIPVDPLKPKAPMKTAQLGAGVGLGVVAGVLYGMAIGAASGLEEAQTTEELVSARSAANRLVIGSGLLATAALGAGVSAVLVEDGAGLGLSWRW